MKKNIKIFLVIFVLAFLAWDFATEYQNVGLYSVNSWTEDVNADCAVVLTGGAHRVRTGFDLLSRHQVKKLIVSGVYPNATLRELFPIWPLYGEISEKDIVLERRSSTTYGNAQQSLPLTEALNCRDVALITSQTHMYRAIKTFKATYPETIQLIPYAVNAGRGERGLIETSTEALKTMFYRIWAY